MNTRYLFPPNSMCVSSSPSPASGGQSRPPRAPPTFTIRLAMRVSRSRWFTFLRRVFHYQNGSSSDLGSNPFDSGTWMASELTALLVQISVTTITVAISKKERPVWPMRMWLVGYDIGCFLGLLLLYGRFRSLRLGQLPSGFSVSETEHQRGIEESRITQLTSKCRASLDLFFAIWFVMGNVWVFDSRFSSFHRAPRLHVLSIALLAWNAMAYSFPFLLFLLLCCCVPLVSALLGYNMNAGSTHRGASDEQILRLKSWNYEALDIESELGSSDQECDIDEAGNEECCICLAKYKEKEEVRELPCQHTFHLRCVDQWLRIISCCPLCKQQLKT